VYDALLRQASVRNKDDLEVIGGKQEGRAEGEVRAGGALE
jgi:hypothetical protein